MENEIAQLKNEIKELKDTMNEVVAMMKAVYEFEEEDEGTTRWLF